MRRRRPLQYKWSIVTSSGQQLLSSDDERALFGVGNGNSVRCPALVFISFSDIVLFKINTQQIVTIPSAKLRKGVYNVTLTVTVEGDTAPGLLNLLEVSA